MSYERLICDAGWRIQGWLLVGVRYYVRYICSSVRSGRISSVMGWTGCGVSSVVSCVALYRQLHLQIFILLPQFHFLSSVLTSVSVQSGPYLTLPVLPGVCTMIKVKLSSSGTVITDQSIPADLLTSFRLRMSSWSSFPASYWPRPRMRPRADSWRCRCRT